MEVIQIPTPTGFSQQSLGATRVGAPREIETKIREPQPATP
jgi:hypothetical protein